MAETNTMDVIFVDYLLPGETKKQTVPLKEFLTLPQDQLTEQNQKIQKALGQLYKLNDREPPLFHSFPKREVGPLVIDCTPITEGNFGAHYVSGENKVEIVESELESTELHLIDIFAHELKHAEQFSEELNEIWNKSKKDDGLAFHQLGYLIEAQAYAFGNYVTYLFQLESSYPEIHWRYDKPIYPILEKHTQGKSIDNFSDFQCEIMEKVLPIIYEDELYRDEYDLRSPILRRDKGLTVEDIPVSFHFKQSGVILSLLKDMPREAMTLEGRKMQLQKAHSAIFEAISRGSTESLKTSVENELKSGEMPPNELLTIIKIKFTEVENKQPIILVDSSQLHIDYIYVPIAAEQIQNSKDVLKFLLDLQVDGKPLMQEKDISDLLNGARASGRKDVEDALLAYKTDHPDDKRFSDKMFELNPNDKITEFLKRQERKAAEVEAAAKNAAKKATNKGVSAVTAAIKAAKSK